MWYKQTSLKAPALCGINRHHSGVKEEPLQTFEDEPLEHSQPVMESECVTHVSEGVLIVIFIGQWCSKSETLMD